MAIDLVRRALMAGLATCSRFFEASKEDDSNGAAALTVRRLVVRSDFNFEDR